MILPAAYIERAPAHDLGRLRAAASVKLGILFRYRNESELRALVRLQASPRSPLFKHYLTRAQWNATFAPDARDVARTIASLERAGFRISDLADNRGFAYATASASVVERTFATQFHVFARSGRVGYRNTRPAVIPKTLPAIVALSGLDTIDAMQLPIHRVAPRPEAMTGRAYAANARVDVTATASPRPISTTTPGPNPSPEPTLVTGAGYVRGSDTAYGPVALALAYDYPVMHGYGGRGRAIATVGSGDFLDADLKTFAAQYAVPLSGTVHRISVNGGPGDKAGQNTQPNLEATLDVEASLGLAPGVNFYAYEIPDGFDSSVEAAYNQIVSDDVVDVVSSSFTDCENFNSAIEYAQGYLAMQGAAKGITFVASAGDSNGLACYSIVQQAGNASLNIFVSVGIPAADQYFTAVDGSDLVVDTNGNYVAETGFEMGTGGTSVFEPRPDWQAATSGTVASGRTVPDIALDAGNATGYDVYFIDTFLPTGGTSLSSPLFAAMIAEIDEVEGTRNGWVNPRLYQIVNQQSYGYAFRDITLGTDGLYTATTGYDEESGLGSVKAWELAGEL
jgi:subtilase family serine protease